MFFICSQVLCIKETMHKNNIRHKVDYQQSRSKKRGRGAISNRAGRFESLITEDVDDGWNSLEKVPNKLVTSFQTDHSRTVISSNGSPDLTFDRSVNPYRGCEHGCIYCYARSTHSFMGLSPGQDFESQIFIKREAPSILKQQLKHQKYRCKVLALGTNTDPYQPIERKLKITRQLLGVLSEFRHPTTIITKSDLIIRDIDILKSMAKLNIVKVTFSFTTLSKQLARILEPRATTPLKRLDAIKILSHAGIPTGVNFAPVIPALNDHELEKILYQCVAAGSIEANYILLRLPGEISDLFKEWLQLYFPRQYTRVLNRLSDMHLGKDYNSSFWLRQTGSGPEAELFKRRFVLAKKRLGIKSTSTDLDLNLFRIPPSADGQLNLL